jgi:hypothetical protein
MIPANTFWNPPRATFKELKHLFGSFLFPPDRRKRISRLLFDQLSLGIQLSEFGGDVLGISDTIKALEGAGTRSHVKPPELFEHPPLEGLWHSHYFTARFMERNVVNHFKKVLGDEHQRSEWGADVQLILDTTTDLKQALSQVAGRDVPGHYRARANADELTGEWVVYAKDTSGKNHYLCVAEHHAGGRHIYDLIKSRCEPRFLALLPEHEENPLDDTIDTDRRGA